MRRLLPGPADPVDALELYAADERRPRQASTWVLINMVASVDGATAVDGRAGGLGGPGDRLIFHGLRTLADAILVGAATVRAENYGPPKLSDAERAARVARGQNPLPTIAVISQSLVFPSDGRLLTEVPRGNERWRPTVLTTRSADPARREQLERRADVIVAGDDRVDPAAALAALADRGATVVLCEGGPTLNGDLLAARLVDELCLTVAPMLVGGRSRRAIEGQVVDEPTRMTIDRVLEEDGFLFLRYLAV